MIKHKIVIISDTHNNFWELENRFKLNPADIIIHCGDLTGMGTSNQLKKGLDWFSNLDQYKHKIIIAGNHDMLFDRNPYIAKKLIPDNIIYLEHDMVNINGLNIFGSPYTPIFFNWAFMRDETQLNRLYNMIPNNIDILITHGPPYGILDKSYYGDEHCGSKSLREIVIKKIKPKIHCFGHIHETYGDEMIDGVHFINASVLDEDYILSNAPYEIEIIK